MKCLILKYLIAILFFLFTPFLDFQQVVGQHKAFSVSLGGKEIGEITASLTASGKTETYKVKSDVKFKALWKSYHRETNHFVVYENKQLKKSASSVYMNEELEDSTTTNRGQLKMNCYRYPDEQFVQNEHQIKFTTAKLYFQEPVNVDNIYSERFLAYCKVELVGKNKYKLHLTNGKKNYYTYTNGVLTEVFVDRTLFNLFFRPK